MDVEPEKRLGQRRVVGEGGKRVVGILGALRRQHGSQCPLDSLVPLIGGQWRQTHCAGFLSVQENHILISNQ